MKNAAAIAVSILIITLGFIVPEAHAQSPQRIPAAARPKIKLHAEYGLRGGLCLASVSGDLTKSYLDSVGMVKQVYTWSPNMVAGVSAGGFVSVRLTQQFYFQTEIILSMKGFQSQDGMSKITLFYFDFPFLLKYRLPTQDSLRVHIFAGPALNLLAGARYQIGLDSRGVVNDFQKYDISAVVGGDITIPSGKGYFILDLRYGYGLISVDNTRGKLDISNRALILSIGFIL